MFNNLEPVRLCYLKMDMYVGGRTHFGHFHIWTFSQMDHYWIAYLLFWSWPTAFHWILVVFFGLESIRCLLFPSVFAFTDDKFLQVLRFIFTCLVFVFSRNSLSPYFLVLSVHRILIFLFSFSFCFDVGIQKYLKTMPSLLHTVIFLESWVFHIVH